MLGFKPFTCCFVPNLDWLRRICHGLERVWRTGYHRDMSYVLCDISAFRFHRIPPQALALYPPLPDSLGDPQRRALRANPFATEALGLPLHTLTTDERARNRGKSVISHVRSGGCPSGEIWPSAHGLKVTSPLYTLLTLAPSVSETQLLMAAYEMCGSFAVYRPGERLEQALEHVYSSGEMPSSFGWKRAPGGHGRPSSLWMREPLIGIDELRAFAKEHQGDRGGKKLLCVSQSVTGTVASPLEAQASILLSVSRRKGGEGFDALENNVRIDLSRSAKSIAGQNKAYADLLLLSKDQMHAVIVECQGLSVHGVTGVSGEDAGRATALQSMGYDVVLITQAQLADRMRFSAVSRMLHERLGYPYREKTPAMAAREADLRSELFIDWQTLCQ